MFHSHIDPDKFKVISDVHINHKNIVKGVSSWNDLSTCRDFRSTGEMNRVIIEAINDTVKEDDHLFHLGDIIFGDKLQLFEIRKMIRCKNLYHIFGNHDDTIRNFDRLNEVFSWYGDYLEIFLGEQLVCMFHYPISIWRECHKGSWCLCGHSHGQFIGSSKDNINGKILDVSWECFKKPLDFYEIQDIMSKKTPIKHH